MFLADVFVGLFKAEFLKMRSRTLEGGLVRACQHTTSSLWEWNLCTCPGAIVLSHASDKLNKGVTMGHADSYDTVNQNGKNYK